MPCLGVTAPRSSTRDAVRVAHPGIVKPCVDRDPLRLNFPGFCHSLRYSPQRALEAGYLEGQALNKWPRGICVKNLLPLALLTGLTASNSFVCQQLQMEARSVAVGRAGPGPVGLQRLHTGSSVRAGSCHVCCGGWWFLTRRHRLCPCVCKTCFSASS